MCFSWGVYVESRGSIQAGGKEEDNKSKSERENNSDAMEYCDIHYMTRAR